MSIEIKIPKEINKYEAKFIGPFTLRQSVALVVALPVSVILYNLLRQYAPMELASIVCLVPAAAAYLFGWFKPYGMKFEEFLRSVFISSFVAPSKRKYKTENYFAKLAEAIEKEERQAKESQKGKKKTKYKRSREAIR